MVLWESDSPETFPIQSNPHFWNHQISWQYNENIMGYHLDAWHIEKTIMILALSIPCAELLHHQYPLIKNKFWDKVLWAGIIGIWWDGIFLISYKKN